MVRLHLMPVRLPFDGRVVKYAVQEITPQSITLLLASLMRMSEKVPSSVRSKQKEREVSRSRLWARLFL
ncbi:hypothetical protein BDL97_02G175700 [Sphagnum fallax]|uniref:Uncharacterized protein n=1 Tax=Sphagnum jensenii TaxID=128206 RepID=A0ABP1BAB5_9BRYO|nr:hypothetical protein BDL97_02G175700 [Sphagnum fallax]